MKKYKISLRTFGCRTNQSESAVILKSFEAENSFKIVDIEEPSDISVINTCTVTSKGDSDTRKFINKLIRLNPKIKIALIGCQCEIQKEKLLKMPNVNWVIGTQNKMDIASIVQKSLDREEGTVVIKKIEQMPFKIPFQSINTKQTRANIKIQDGCDSFCSYCEVPYARGRSRSRYFNDILKEAMFLTSNGFKEIVITGINVGTYKQDNKDIADVVEALNEIKNLKRIRISSIELKTIPQKLINLMAQKTKLCRYLHVPLQNASDKILKLMNRKYTFHEYKDFISNLTNNVPGICIGSDIIVGFPQEDDFDFKKNLDHLKELPVQYFHVFSYSQRNMARSKNLTGIISPKEISLRSKILRELSLNKRKVFYKSMLDSKCEVLLENEKENYWNGLTDNYIRVKVKSDRNLSNCIKTIILKNIDGQYIKGEIVD